MRTTARAVVALVLLAGVYVLASTIAGLLAYGAYEAVTRGGGAPGAELVVILAVAVAVSAVLVPVAGAVLRARRNRRDGVVGIALTPEQQPQLWGLVRSMARKVGTRPPDEIRLVADVNAAVGEDTRWLGLVSRQRTMYLGVPLLVGLDDAQMASVLAHELGHYSGNHTRLAPAVYRGQEVLAQLMQRLGPRSFVGLVFAGYTTVYLGVARGVSRRQELEADVVAARIVGSAAATGALREVHVIDGAWNFFLEAYVQRGSDVGLRPSGIFQGFASFVGEPTRMSQLAEIRALPLDERPSRLDSHPPTSARIAALERLAAPPTGFPRGRALELLDQPDVVLAALEVALYLGSDLRAASWDEVAAAAYLQTSLEIAGHARRPLLDTVRMLTAGADRELTKKLVRHEAGMTEVRAIAGLIATRSLQAALVERRGARFAHSWSDVVELVDDTGSRLEVEPLVEASFSDPAQRKALARFVEAEGIADFVSPVDPDNRPDVGPVVLGLLLVHQRYRARVLMVTDRSVVVGRVPRLAGGWQPELAVPGRPLGVLRRTAACGYDVLLAERDTRVLAFADIASVKVNRSGTVVRVKPRVGRARRFKVPHPASGLGDPYPALEKGLSGL